MSALIAVLIPILIIVAVAAIVILIVERFSPDPTVTVIIRWIVFICVLIAIINKLLPLLK